MKGNDILSKLISEMPLQSLIPYWGGKYMQCKKEVEYILEIIQNNKAYGYVEICGGGAHTLLSLPRYLVSHRWYNEVDFGLCQLFHCVQNYDTAWQLIRLLKEIPYNYEFFKYARDNRSNPDIDMLTSAAFTYICAKQSRSSDLHTYRLTTTIGGHPIDEDCVLENLATKRQYYAGLNDIVRYTEILEGVTITSIDFRDILESLKSKHIVTFCDPPYHPITRHQGSLEIYPGELTRADHIEMVDILCKSRSWILCGYDPLEYENVVLKSNMDPEQCGCYDYLPLEDAGAKKICLGSYKLGASTEDESVKNEYLWIMK